MAQTQTTSFSEQFQPLLDKLIGTVQGNLDWGYHQYPGQRVAGFAPDQLGAFGNIRGTVNDPRYSQGWNTARNMTYGAFSAPNTQVATRSFGPQALEQYMSPFTTQVVDAARADIDHDTQVALARTAARLAAKRGGGQLGEGEDLAYNDLEDKGLRAKNTALSQIRERGYGTALGAYQSEAQRGLDAARANQTSALQNRALGLQGARDYAGLNAAQYSQGLQGADALLKSGALQQSQNQRVADTAYQDWRGAEDYGRNTANWLAGILYGSPKTSTTEGAASPWATAAGLGMSGLGVLGGSGAFGSNGWLSGLFSGAGSGSSFLSGAGGAGDLLVIKDGGRIGYARGGRMRRYADGGLYPEDDGGLYPDEDDAASDELPTLDDDPEDEAAFADDDDEPDGLGAFGGVMEMLPPTDIGEGGGADETGGDYDPGARGGLASRMQGSGYTSADLMAIMKGLQPRSYSAPGMLEGIDNPALIAGLAILANADKGLTGALGAGGTAAVQSLASKKKQQQAEEALRIKGETAKAAIVGKMVAADQDAQNKALTAEYTTGAANERNERTVSGQAEKARLDRDARAAEKVLDRKMHVQLEAMQAGRPTALMKDIMSMGHKVGTPEFKEAMAQALAPSGFMVEFGVDGKPTLIKAGKGAGAGGAEDMEKKTKGTIEEQILNNSARIERMNSIMQKYKPEYLTLGAQGKNWLTATAEWAGLNPGDVRRKALEDFTQFRASAYADLNQTLKDMSGAAVTDQEYQRLIKVLGDPAKDSPTEFQAKVKDVTSAVRRAQSRLFYMKEKGLERSKLGGVALEDMPKIMDARGQEIEKQIRTANPAMPEDEIVSQTRRKVNQEFGVQ